MKNPKYLLGITAIAVVVLGILVALVMIIAIWNDFQGRNIGKIIGTLVILLLLAMVLHAVAKGMCEKPKDPM